MTTDSMHSFPFIRRIAALASFCVIGGATALAQGPSISVDQTAYAAGEEIRITFAGGPGNEADWIGLYPAGIIPGDQPAAWWTYVPGPDLTQGEVTVEGGLNVGGDWTAYLLENDAYTVLAEASFEVLPAPSTSPVYSRHSAYQPNEPIEIGWSNGPGNARDWIGIYPQGTTPGAVASTLWLYVDGTQSGNTGLREGTVRFEGGLALAGDYEAHLLENDGYTVLGTTQFSLVGPFDPLLRSDRRFYGVGEPIALTFSNGFGWTKDWIGIYPAGVTPGEQDSTLWLYADGTQTGNVGLWEGTVTFTSGLTEPGDYVAYFLENDGYFILAEERITIRAGDQGLRLLTLQPPDDGTDVDPRIRFAATVAGGTVGLDLDSVRLTLNGTEVAALVTPAGDNYEISFEQAGVFPSESTHEFVLTFQDDGAPAGDYVHSTRFTVTAYQDIRLPAPIVFENFDTVPEGGLPAGWSERSYTEITNPEEDLTNLDSASYGRWLAVEAARFEGPLTPYSQFGNETTDYQRVLTPNPRNIIDGHPWEGPLAQGRLLFGNSGYRIGQSQVVYLFTPDFNLSGQTDVHLSFHSLWEQNQDSLGAVEYSIDGGQNWLPVVYFLDGNDLVTMTDPATGETAVDAIATLTAEHGDVARYTDEALQERGGYYGAFIAAPISQDLAPFLSARVDDDPRESKRVELFRLPAADGQARVRFRFAHAGTDSWYFGIDNFGLYSIPGEVEPPVLSIARAGDQVTLSWPAEAGPVTLEQSPSVAGPTWTPVPGVSGTSITLPASAETRFFRLRQP